MRPDERSQTACKTRKRWVSLFRNVPNQPVRYFPNDYSISTGRRLTDKEVVNKTAPNWRRACARGRALAPRGSGHAQSGAPAAFRAALSRAFDSAMTGHYVCTCQGSFPA